MKFTRFITLSILVIFVSASAWAQQIRRAENFTARSMAGKQVNLADLRGKVVLLTFWSSRCAICQSEIPNLNRLATAYSHSDVVFLAATAENENTVGSFIRNNPFNFDILPDSFGLLLKYADRDRLGNVNMGYPAYYLIDQSGAVKYRASGWDKVRMLDSAINRLLSSTVAGR